MSEHEAAIEEHTQPAYVAVATVIFALVSFTFLFPCNFLIPLDRRTIAVVGALACYLSRSFFFPSFAMDVISAVDFEVLILLSSIMIINHIVIHLRETKNLVEYFQKIIASNPSQGFWLLSFISFIISPFLTNDGVCLLFVEPVLHIFEEVKNKVGTVESSDGNDEKNNNNNGKVKELRSSDALYFLLALACSTNIGSALTYTGNPQNMIVASDAIGVMPSYKFIAYMLLPSLVTWFMTIKWVEYCWLSARATEQSLIPSEDIELNPIRQDVEGQFLDRVEADGSSKKLSLSLISCSSPSSPSEKSKKNSIEAGALSPRRRLAREKEKTTKKVVRYVQSPMPYLIVAMLFVMIILVFVDVMPISGLICLASILMVLAVVLGNHWRNRVIWEMENEYDYYYQAHHTLPQEAAPQPKHKRDQSRSYRHNRNPSNVSTAVHAPPTRDLLGGSSPEGWVTMDEQKEQHEGLIPSSTPTQIKEEVVVKASDENNSKEKNTSAVADPLGPMTREDRIDNLNEFFDAMFSSIDYSLLLIFLGTFIVVANMSSTGVPRKFWNSLVGEVPFQTLSSVVGISLFVLVASQLLGNVAVIQLAKPNIEHLDDNSKRFAWALLSFIATIGGNLTITGSAANIIVAEKANRLDATISMDFFRHYKVCFWITLASCLVGGALVALIVSADNASGSNW